MAGTKFTVKFLLEWLTNTEMKKKVYYKRPQLVAQTVKGRWGVRVYDNLVTVWVAAIIGFSSYFLFQSWGWLRNFWLIILHCHHHQLGCFSYLRLCPKNIQIFPVLKICVFWYFNSDTSVIKFPTSAPHPQRNKLSWDEGCLCAFYLF